MSNLRELTNAELDMVCGGTLSMSNGCNTGTATLVGVGSSEPFGIRLAEEIICDVLRILEPNTGLKRPTLHCSRERLRAKPNQQVIEVHRDMFKGRE
jgi:hypothetical protein